MFFFPTGVDRLEIGQTYLEFYEAVFSEANINRWYFNILLQIYRFYPCNIIKSPCTSTTRKHSSRMRTVLSAAVAGRGGSMYPSMHWAGGCVPRRGVSAGGACQAPPPCEQNDWQTSVKTLPCRNYVADGKNIGIMVKQFIAPHKRSLGQGNIFTPVCHSVHRGGLPSRRPPLAGSPLLEGGTPPGRETPLGRRPPAGRTPREGGTPPPTATAAGGTHRTGMHSCFKIGIARF